MLFLMRVAVGALGFTNANRIVPAVRVAAGGGHLMHHWCGARIIMAKTGMSSLLWRWHGNISRN